MGAVCCSGGPSATGIQNAPMFSGFYNTGKGIPQILFLGPEGSGKTTLMYSTIIPDWSNIINAMEPTIAFHYEETSRDGIQFGIWEVSGCAAMVPLWSSFYRHISFDALFFIVSVLDSNLSSTREWIRRLLNEDELRQTQIIVVINTFDQSSEDAERMVGSVSRGLGLSELKIWADKERFSWCIVNCKEGEKDPEWQKIIMWLLDSIRRKYGGMSTPQPQQQTYQTQQQQP